MGEQREESAAAPDPTPVPETATGNSSNEENAGPRTADETVQDATPLPGGNQASGIGPSGGAASASLDAERASPSDAGPRIDMERLSVGEAVAALGKWFNFTASLPERTVRCASALAGGVVRESANWLIPAAFRNSRSYSIFVQQMLDFLANDIGGVARSTPEGIAPRGPEQVDLARKTVGNLLDMTALATLHLSPITVLAVFSDVAYGSKVYLQELSRRLKEQGLIDRETTIDQAVDLIDALEAASGEATQMFDQPPVSIEGLRKTLRETQEAIQRADPTKLLPKSEIEQLWRQMELAAAEQHASLWDVSATVSVVALRNIQAVGQGTITSLEIAGDMFNQQIIQHYWNGLRQIERQGLVATLSTAAGPYIEAVWNNFATERKTWTEQLLSGELWRWSWGKLGWSRPEQA